MKELMTFTYQGNEMRTIQLDGEPWWVLKDVCQVLGIGNSADVYNRLDDDEKGVGQIDTLGGRQNMNVINESGLYNVILRSDKPEAKPFRKWVTSEVLPSIRKTGQYATPKKVQQRLGEVNSAARIIRQTLKEAGMAPQFVAVAMKSLYAPVGVEIPLEGIVLGKRLYDATAMAKHLGVLSKSGQPHAQAISAVIAQVDVSDKEREVVPFQSSKSGHAGTNWQYAESVMEKVQQWLQARDYPSEIVSRERVYKVRYEKMMRVG